MKEYCVCANAIICKGQNCENKKALEAILAKHAAAKTQNQKCEFIRKNKSKIRFLSNRLFLVFYRGEKSPLYMLLCLRKSG